jgi:hypothetical protein
MIGTDTEVIALYPRGLAPLPPDALTVHDPPPLLTRCDDCPDYGCRACIRTATDTTGRPLWSPDAILTTRQPMTDEQLEELREHIRRTESGPRLPRADPARLASAAPARLPLSAALLSPRPAPGRVAPSTDTRPEGPT